LDSEGQSEFDKNIAQGRKNATVLNSEAQRLELENIAMGEAFSMKQRAIAQAESIRVISNAINEIGGEKAVSFQIAQTYIAAFEKLAKEGNTLIIPSNVNDIASIVTQATSVYKTISEKSKSLPSTSNITQDEAVERLAKELHSNKENISKFQ